MSKCNMDLIVDKGEELSKQVKLLRNLVSDFYADSRSMEQIVELCAQLKNSRTKCHELDGMLYKYINHELPHVLNIRKEDENDYF